MSLGISISMGWSFHQEGLDYCYQHHQHCMEGWFHFIVHMTRKSSAESIMQVRRCNVCVAVGGLSNTIFVDSGGVVRAT